MISVDRPEDNRKFAERHHADFPILSDPGRTAARAYGVLGAFGLARRWTFYIGPDGTIAAVDKSPGTLRAGAKVAAHLRELRERLAPREP
jgi:peroxiredoxin Q/BCP